MADDYIGRKMEDYLSSRPKSAPIRRPSVYGVKPGTMNIPYPLRRVLVTDGLGAYGAAIVEAFRSAGCSVAFMADDSKSGALLAQKTGSRFYPTDYDDVKSVMNRVMADWGGIDVVIDNIGNEECIVAFSDYRLEHCPEASFGRVISIVNGDAVCEPFSLGNGATVNQIHASVSVQDEQVARLCMFLVEPAASCINNHIFRLTRD